MRSEFGLGSSLNNPCKGAIGSTLAWWLRDLWQLCMIVALEEVQRVHVIVQLGRFL